MGFRVLSETIIESETREETALGLFDRFERAAVQPATSAVHHEPGSVEAMAAANAQLVRYLRGVARDVPGRGYVLARTISRHLDDVVADPSARLMDAGARINLERMATTHLPDTINAYLGARSVENADAMLIEQLSTMERVAATAAARSIEAARDAFLVQGSFLEDKYGAGYA